MTRWWNHTALNGLLIHMYTDAVEVVFASPIDELDWVLPQCGGISGESWGSLKTHPLGWARGARFLSTGARRVDERSRMARR